MTMYAILFHVPVTHVEAVKNAVFAAGAGKIGAYSHSSWQVLGEGQYKPEVGSNPFKGEIGKLEKEAEYKVEMVCEDAFIKQAIHALKQAHPHETPYYEVWKLEDI